MVFMDNVSDKRPKSNSDNNPIFDTHIFVSKTAKKTKATYNSTYLPNT